MMKRGQKSPLACPVCGSRVRKTRSQLEGWILPERYCCDDCKYIGFLALERDPGVEDEASQTP